MIEARLLRANQKYSEALSQNQVFRDQIDTLRRERVIFETVFGKLEKDLGVKRSNIVKLVETVGQDFDKRDKAIETLRILQQQHSEGSAQAQLNNDLSDLQTEEVSVDDSTSKMSHASQGNEKVKTDLQKMQQAMKKPLSPGELAQKFIQQEEDSFNLFTAVGKLKSQVENTET